jgi:anti-anti-sigma regulatory factor
VTDRGTVADDGNETGPWLRVELHTQGRRCTLVLCGMLWGTSIAALEAQVDQLGCLPYDHVVVDVGGLEALDPVGANVLLGLYHYVHGRGGNLRITGARGPVATALRQYAVEYAEADEHLTRAIDDRSGVMASGSFPGLDGRWVRRT